jgi:hypothetical protein
MLGLLQVPVPAIEEDSLNQMPHAALRLHVDHLVRVPAPTAQPSQQLVLLDQLGHQGKGKSKTLALQRVLFDCSKLALVLD